MAYISSHRRAPFPQTSRVVIDTFGGGLCVDSTQTNMRDDQSPDMLNTHFRDGMLCSRDGLKRVFNFASGQDGGKVSLEGGLNGLLGEVYRGYYLFHIGSLLLRWSGRQDTPPVVVSTTMADAPSLLFRFMDHVYVNSGGRYLRLDKGFGLEEVEPYVPVVAINCSASFSSSTPHEQFNMIGTGFTVWYNAGGLVYQLPYKNLGSEVSVEVDGQLLGAGGYVFDPVEGKVTLSAAPVSGGISNVRITAHVASEAIAESRAKILDCTYACQYGGSSALGTRVLLCGNPRWGAYYFRSGLMNPSYFPDMEYEIVGTGSERITALAQQYGTLMALCESSIYAISYQAQNGSPIFTCRQVNSRVGSDIPGSVQLIDNRLVFANTTGGVYLIDRIDGTDERNVKQISRNINGSRELGRGLLSESPDALRGAVSADYGGRYLLTAGERTYVWDYSARPWVDTGSGETAQCRLVWFLFDNIRAAGYIPTHEALCYVAGQGPDHAAGTVCAFAEGEGDFGSDLKARYTTRNFDFGSPDLKKRLASCTVTSNSYGGTNFNMEALCDGRRSGVYSVRNSDFSWKSLDWGAFYWGVEACVKSLRYIASSREGVFHAFRFSNRRGSFNLVKLTIELSRMGN